MIFLLFAERIINRILFLVTNVAFLCPFDESDTFLR